MCDFHHIHTTSSYYIWEISRLMMKRQKISHEEFDKKYLPIDYANNKPFLKFCEIFSQILTLCLFLEQTISPRDVEGYPRYEIKTNSLLKKKVGEWTKDDLKNVVSIFSNILSLKTNDIDNWCIILNLHEMKPTDVTPKKVKQKILSLGSVFQSKLKAFIEDHGEGWESKLLNHTKPVSINRQLVCESSFNECFNPTDFLTTIKQLPFYESQIVPGGQFTIPPKKAIYEEATDLLSTEIIQALAKYWNRSLDETKLYKHQVLALKSLQKGRSILVSTYTSSGKSLIYQLPILDRLYKCSKTKISNLPTAFFIFPTKALAQDQLRAFTLLSDLIFDSKNAKIISGTYDRDTEKDERKRLRNEAHVIFTNPDMIHAEILPGWNSKWEEFLKSLKYIVIDEIHTYTGYFGTNVMFTLRRLKRICSELGNSDIQVISCSATISNADTHLKAMFALTDSEIDIIDSSKDGAPRGKKHWLIWNSPKVSTHGIYDRAHPIQDGTKLLAELVIRGARTIAFCKIRRVCELLMISTQDELEKRGYGNLKSKVMSYRGGYSREDRRNIEQRMFTGELMGIIATSALELGIDIGELDVVLIVGFPYNISNLRQQSGRAGRRSQGSLVILIGGSDPVDQHYMAHPRNVEEQTIISTPVSINKNIILAHIQCAASELLIDVDSDSKYFVLPETIFTIEYFQSMVKDYLVPVTAEGLVLYSPSENWGFDDSRFSLRTSSDEELEETGFSVIENNNNSAKILEKVEESRVPFVLYQGAIYLFQGNKYRVEYMNLKGRFAQVKKVHADYVTKTRDYTDVDPYKLQAAKELCPVKENEYSVMQGTVQIRTCVFAYYKLTKGKSGGYSQIMESLPIAEGHQNIYNFFSPGLWVDLPSKLMEKISSLEISMAAAIHAAEHVILSMIPLIITSYVEPQDLGTECKSPEKELKKAHFHRLRPSRLIFFENCTKMLERPKLGYFGDKSTGIMEQVYKNFEKIVKSALERLNDCRCESGCPECVASPYCVEKSVIISKPGAILILRYLNGVPLNEDSLPKSKNKVLPKLTIVM